MAPPSSLLPGDIHGRCHPIGPTTPPGIGDANKAIDSLRHCLSGVAVTNQHENTVTVFTKNERDSDFTRTTISTAGPRTGISPGGLAIGDLSGSGKLDLATANSVSGDVTLLTNTTQRIRLGG